MNEIRQVEVGDRVKYNTFFADEFGTVFDLFEDNGTRYAQVEWNVRGNQYTGGYRKKCRVETVSSLVVMVRGAPNPNKCLIGQGENERCY